MAEFFYTVKTIETMYEQMKQYMIGNGSSLTNFNEGSRTRNILEAVALVSHDSQFDFFQAVRKIIPVAVFNGFEFPKLEGNRASGSIHYGRQEAATEDIPIAIGTAILLDGITYITLEEGVILTGNTQTATALSAQANVVGPTANIGINGIDTQNGQGQFTNQPIGVDFAWNPVPFGGGTAEETSDERLVRFRKYINSLARSTALGLESGALSVAGVVSATVVSNFPSPGFVTVFCDDGTGVLAPATQTEVEKVLNGDESDRINYPGYRAAGIQVIVDAPTVKNVDLVFQIRVLNNAQSEDAALIEIAKNASLTYINTLKLGYDVIQSELIKSIKQVNDDIYDVIVSEPISNVAINPDEVARSGEGVAGGSDPVITVQRVGA
jgi:hypothetical protein